MMAITEFIPIATKDSYVRELAFISDGEEVKFMLMSLSPVILGSWSMVSGPANEELVVRSGGKETAVITLSLENSIPHKSGYLLLWRPKKSRLLLSSFKESQLETRLMLRQSRKSKFQFKLQDIVHMAAAYFIPRKVYVVVVESEDYLNIFPMDLHLKAPFDGGYAFALQVTNLAESKIREIKKVLVCELEAQDMSMAYSLGRNHGKTCLSKEDLPFGYGRSHTFDMVLPDFAKGYREIQINKHHSFLSHTVFLGEVLFDTTQSVQCEQPYHLHRFHYAYLLKKNEMTYTKIEVG